eukprot:2538352-Rhodomonas_salina.1
MKRSAQGQRSLASEHSTHSRAPSPEQVCTVFTRDHHHKLRRRREAHSLAALRLSSCITALFRRSAFARRSRDTPVPVVRDDSGLENPDSGCSLKLAGSAWPCSTSTKPIVLVNCGASVSASSSSTTWRPGSGTLSGLAGDSEGASGRCERSAGGFPPSA